MTTDQHVIGPHAALIYTMVLAAAADNDISDRELKLMGNLINTLPVFADYDSDKLPQVCSDCARVLEHEEGLETVLGLVRDTLPPALRETAYLLACEVAAIDRHLGQEELRLLELVRHRLDIDRLHAAALERAVRARMATA
ncbi:MAG: tellurite resistance TerB family protein [Rhodospirillaceae bacterium]